ncbi:hypothetical protein BBI09_05905 [Stutzerimonas xanthomarina]|nr:hypothetical protein BBI09_05905 [Stutzerimonas xanthomarina]
MLVQPIRPQMASEAGINIFMMRILLLSQCQPLSWRPGKSVTFAIAAAGAVVDAMPFVTYAA